MRTYTVLLARLVAVVALAISGTSILPAVAQQAYPSRPVTVIVPYPAGGVIDLMVRNVGRAFAERTGSSFVVENKPGGNTQLAANACRNARPDGYTVCLLSMSTMSLNPIFYAGKLGYDPVGDFEPITNIALVEHMIVLHRSVPANSLSELVSYAKANPDKLNYGSQGIGGDAHLTFEWIKRITGAPITHIPFNGTAPAMLAFERGDVQLLSLTPGNGNLLEQIKTGKIKAILVEGDERISLLPDTPSFKEAGLPPFRARSWFGLFAPKGTPRELVASLSERVIGIVKDPEFQKTHLIPNGFSPIASSPIEFAREMTESRSAAADLVSMAGVKVEN